MPLQYNMGPGGLMYSPSRDFAYQYPAMIKRMRENFNHHNCPELEAVVEAGMLATFEPKRPGDVPDVFGELDKANVAYSRFLEICCENPEETVADCLERSGFNDVHPAAQFGWLAMMGTIMTGQMFVGLRDITTRGPTAVTDEQEMNQAGDEASDAINKVTPIANADEDD